MNTDKFIPEVDKLSLSEKPLKNSSAVAKPLSDYQLKKVQTITLIRYFMSTIIYVFSYSLIKLQFEKSIL